jgi:hypothetical protein
VTVPASGGGWVARTIRYNLTPRGPENLAAHRASMANRRFKCKVPYFSRWACCTSLRGFCINDERTYSNR